jgi:hypothetical protein
LKLQQGLNIPKGFVLQQGLILKKMKNLGGPELNFPKIALGIYSLQSYIRPLWLSHDHPPSQVRFLLDRDAQGYQEVRKGVFGMSRKQA